MAIFCHPFWIDNVYNVPVALLQLYLEQGFADAFELVGGLTNHENTLQVAFYQDMLTKGCRIPTVGNSDSHGTVDRAFRYRENPGVRPGERPGGDHRGGEKPLQYPPGRIRGTGAAVSRLLPADELRHVPV